MNTGTQYKDAQVRSLQPVQALYRFDLILSQIDLLQPRKVNVLDVCEDACPEVIAYMIGLVQT